MKKNTINIIKILWKKSNNYLKLTDKIKNLKTIDSFDDISNSFQVYNSEIEYVINIDNDNVTIDDGKILFDNIKATFIFPFIKFIDNKGETYYKIYNKIPYFTYFINKEKELPDSRNTLFLIVNPYLYRNKFFNKIIQLDFENSTINIQYPENFVEFIKDKVTKLIPNIVLHKEIGKNIIGEFQIVFPEYDNFKFYYMTLFDSITKEFIFFKRRLFFKKFKRKS